MGRVWSDRVVRGYAWQGLALLIAGALAVYLGLNLADNLAKRGITSGFGFLGDTAGFGVTTSLIPYSEQSSYARAFVVGLLNTLLVSALGIVAATVIGFALGLARLSPNWLLARLAFGYVEVVRNIPLLLQIFFWYFAVIQALPSPRGSLALGQAVFLNNRGLHIPGIDDGSGTFAWLAAAAIAAWLAAFVLRRRNRWAAAGAVAIGIALAVLALVLAEWSRPVLRGFNFRGGWILIPELVALGAALSIYTAAFIAEVVRGGIQAVPRGQTEAALALGLSRAQTMWHVVVPQALRVIIPPLTNQYLNLTKNSSLAAAIAYPDLVSVFAGTVLNQTGQAVEVIAITMAVYLAISLTIAAAMNRYNRRIATRGG